MSVGPDRFELAVFNPETDTRISCREYLRERDAGRIAWLPRVDDSALCLYTDEREWLADEWNLGDLRLIVRQLRDVLGRLERDEAAILRSGVLDQFSVPYFLFEPSASGDAIMISQFLIPDDEMSQAFPIPYWADNEPQQLFAYVLGHRTELLGLEPGLSTDTGVLREQRFPSSVLLSSLPIEIALGQRIVDLIAGDLESADC